MAAKSGMRCPQLAMLLLLLIRPYGVATPRPSQMEVCCPVRSIASSTLAACNPLVSLWVVSDFCGKEVYLGLIPLFNVTIDLGRRAY